jgi:hypothetical protein
MAIEFRIFIIVFAQSSRYFTTSSRSWPSKKIDLEFALKENPHSDLYLHIVVKDMPKKN